MSVSTDLKGIIQDAVAGGPKPYDTQAEVVRIDGGTAYVHIPGGIDETPVQMTIACAVGDTVQVRVGGGRAWLTGNMTAPPTDDAEAIKAKTTATAAGKMAQKAEATAQKAQSAARAVNQYFWHTEQDVGGAGAGAHVTEVPQADFIADPANGGGNVLITSSGMDVRDGTDVLATFGTETSIFTTSGTELAHFGYGPGTSSGGGTSDAPYYTLGVRTGTIGNYSVAEGHTTTASGYIAHAEGRKTTASGQYSHAEGYESTASGAQSHAEGQNTAANWTNSHAEGQNTTASGYASHAEGYGSTASGQYSHAEGEETTASGWHSHAEGSYTTASDFEAHAEGRKTTASGQYSHAEGLYTTASGNVSHAEGHTTIASKNMAHAQNENTIAAKMSQTSAGTYNVEDTATTTTHPGADPLYGQHAVIIGNGTDDNTRSNAAAVQWDGTARLAGDVYVGCNADSTGGYRLPIVQSGHLGGASVSANSYLDRTVTFDKAFPSAPTVVCSIASTATAGALGSFSVSANSITTTGFTARVFNASSGSRTPGVDWIAVY